MQLRNLTKSETWVRTKLFCCHLVLLLTPASCQCARGSAGDGSGAWAPAAWQETWLEFPVQGCPSSGPPCLCILPCLLLGVAACSAGSAGPCSSPSQLHRYKLEHRLPTLTAPSSQPSHLLFPVPYSKNLIVFLYSSALLSVAGQGLMVQLNTAKTLRLLQRIRAVSGL